MGWAIIGAIKQIYNNLDFNGVHVSKFSAKTICDFNNIRATGNPIIFRDNFAKEKVKFKEKNFI